MNIRISGAGGLIGSALVPALRAGGHTVQPLSRGQVGDFGPADAVVHLGGENIAAGRWTAAKKARIHDSRVEGTRRLCEALAGLERPPAVLICASAVGYYGDRGDERLDESSAPGGDYLAGVCREWEAAAEPAVRRGIRVVYLRFGLVLSGGGGALPALAKPFRWGAGGVIGGGRQWWSWIALEDAVRAAHHALVTAELSGPVNAVSPQPATNREFTRILGRVLHRPTFFLLPAFAARLALGEMADALLLSSQRVEPRRLTATGFAFRQPELESALRSALSAGRPSGPG